MSDVQGPVAGLTHEKTITVDGSLLVPSVNPAFGNFADMPPVFATAFMVAFVESACIEALAPFLGAGQATVGSTIAMNHTAATPLGMKVTATVVLTEVAGRRLEFDVTCRDEKDQIGEGKHQRFIIDTPKFLARLAQKAG